MKKNNIEVIFENQDIIVLDKESGISVLPSKDCAAGSEPLIETVKKTLKKEIIPLTSLDADATGIVVFAKNKNAYDFIAKQIKESKAEKRFLIIVNGTILQQEGRIEKRVVTDGERVIINDRGVESIINYKVKEEFKDFTLIEVNPVTSIRNQIRALFWSEGNPLAVDKIYASPDPILLSSLKRRYKGADEEKPLLKRLPLHFSKISFILPVNTQKSVFESPLAKDMEITLKQLRKYNSRTY